jgi:hypothetical protein
MQTSGGVPASGDTMPKHFLLPTIMNKVKEPKSAEQHAARRTRRAGGSSFDTFERFEFRVDSCSLKKTRHHAKTISNHSTVTKKN